MCHTGLVCHADKLKNLMYRPAKSPVSILGLSLLMLCVCSSSAIAAGFRVSNQNAHATARGNAQVASASGPSAVYSNPAALALTEGSESVSELEVGVYAIDFGVDVDHSSGLNYQNTDRWQYAPQFFYSHSESSWGWGLGVYVPFGLGNEWGTDTAFSTITTKAEITYITASPVFAYRLSETLSVGGGLTINSMDADLQQSLGLVPGDSFRFEGDSTEIGYVASFEWSPSEKHSVGGFYRNPVTHNLQGHSDVSFVPGRVESEATLDIPSYAVIGYSYRPSENWNFEADIEWGRWSLLDQVVIENTELGDLPFSFNWTNGLIYQFGVTRQFEKYALSFGYDYNESVQPDGNFTPAIPDADRHWFNVGVRSQVGKLTWSVAYQYGHSNREVTNSQPSVAGEQADGTYHTRSHALQTSIGYRF